MSIKAFPYRRTIIQAGLMLLVLCALGSEALAEKSANVQIFLVQANQAGEWLEKGDLARMEAALEPGFRELELMLEFYEPDGRTNAYLVQRGWGQLIWTQMMYRLLAIRDGLYDKELQFAERVAVEYVADASLRTVENSFEHIETLLAAKDKLDLSQAIDQFAQGIFEGDASAMGYEALVNDFQSRFVFRRAAVQARLKSGTHRGIVDPADLPEGTRYAQIYREHRERLGSENRLDEILNRLAEVDSQQMAELVQVAQNGPTPSAREAARNELKLQLLLVEDSLDAFEHDASVANMVDYYNRWGHLAFEPFGHAGYPGHLDDIQEVMQLVHAAKVAVAEQMQPAQLRNLYSMADLVR